MAAPAISSPRRWQNLPVVRELDRNRARWIWTVLIGLAFALAPVAVYVVQSMRYVEAGYAIEELRKSEERLLESERRLRIERAVREALPGVERNAEKLGLVRPAPDRVIVTRRSGSGPEPRTARSPERLPAVR